MGTDGAVKVLEMCFFFFLQVFIFFGNNVGWEARGVLQN